MFKNAKNGDQVWSTRNGWGIIKNIRTWNSRLLLEVLFEVDVNPTIADYTLDGRAYLSDLYPELFWNSFEIPKEAYQKPRPKLEVDTKVYVRNDYSSSKFKRHFSHFTQDDKIACFKDGKSYWSNNEATDYDIWDNWEIL